MVEEPIGEEHIALEVRNKIVQQIAPLEILLADPVVQVADQKDRRVRLVAEPLSMK